MMANEFKGIHETESIEIYQKKKKLFHSFLLNEMT